MTTPALRAVCLVALSFFFAMPSVLTAVYIGQPRQAVIVELGNPESILKKGDTEILLYPEGQRVMLREAVVIKVQKIPLQDGPIPPSTAGDSTAAPVGTENPTPQPVTTAPATPSLLPIPPLPHAPIPTASHMPPPQPETPDHRESEGENENPFREGPPGMADLIVKLVVLAFMQTAIVRIALRITSVEASWGGTLLVGLADAVSWSLTEFMMERLLGIDLGANLIVSTLVTLIAIQKFTEAKKWATAIRLTVMTQTVSFFVSILILQVILLGIGSMM